jgi:uncharacterized protein YegP (UPF0339 family)
MGSGLAEAYYPCYWIRKDSTGEWRWVLYASGHKEIAMSTIGYNSRLECERSIELVRKSGDYPVIHAT